MSLDIASDFDQFLDGTPRLLSRIYHQHSKLSPYKFLEFQEQVIAYNQQAESEQHQIEKRSYSTRPKIQLPAPSRRRGKRRLSEVLSSRRTRRGEFSSRPISLQQWGHLLGAACGITGEATHPDDPSLVQPLRAWPSAGSIYPVEVYLAPLNSRELDRNWHHYDEAGHQLSVIGKCGEDDTLQQLIYAEGMWEDVSGVLILTAEFHRTQVKYGERGYRFVLLDVGHVAQNILLVCEDLGLAAVPLGGFDDDGLAAEMRLDAELEIPLYVFLIGTRRR